jgi:hypothetical protein
MNGRYVDRGNAASERLWKIDCRNWNIHLSPRGREARRHGARGPQAGRLHLEEG